MNKSYQTWFQESATSNWFTAPLTNFGLCDMFHELFPSKSRMFSSFKPLLLRQGKNFVQNSWFSRNPLTLFVNFLDKLKELLLEILTQPHDRFHCHWFPLSILCGFCFNHLAIGKKKVRKNTLFLVNINWTSFGFNDLCAIQLKLAITKRDRRILQLVDIF